MSADFEVEGLESLLNKLANMGKNGVNIQDNALVEAAQPILTDAKNTKAFEDRTGKLRESLKISKVKKNKDGKFVWVGDIDKKANYSWYVEYGDSKRLPRPFLKPAYEKNKGQILEKIKQAIQNGLNEE
ncbi:HK97 gp10 family phage protein [Clostridium sp. 19966]|uniref:HK97-gp10 family putative phage morphogenesis protein n=1 Tax=Clostridium sp. 19966 TaxID=2768166 RepID=UPI0028DD61CC|nr:HK97-gp10 family putative phage morphogenesis protein [Clostridium sp. 19966]MDT8718985.1 HK97 gp10 family phage protein [Clostridium sp. 19966]